MSFDMLDPWSDAATIAGRLRQPGSFLVVLLAAESWCRKCREFRPVFDRAAQGANAGEVWLWLDLEDHAEFVGDSIPDDLPWLLVYRDKVLWKSGARHRGGIVRGARPRRRAVASLAAAPGHAGQAGQAGQAEHPCAPVAGRLGPLRVALHRRRTAVQ